jgi:hypothetical protein
MGEGAPMSWTGDQQEAIDEFRRCVRVYLANPCEGTKYALHMAAEGALLVGVDPSRITPDGYQHALSERPADA